MDWMKFVEECYEDFKAGKMPKETWAYVAMKALEKLMEENRDVLERLKNSEPEEFSSEGGAEEDRTRPHQGYFYEDGIGESIFQNRLDNY